MEVSTIPGVEEPGKMDPSCDDAEGETEVKMTKGAMLWIWLGRNVFKTHMNCVMPSAVDRRRAKVTVGLVKSTAEKIGYKYLGRPLGGSLIAVALVVVGMSAMPQHNIMKVNQLLASQ
jgi:hypothetical protein